MFQIHVYGHLIALVIFRGRRERQVAQIIENGIILCNYVLHSLNNSLPGRIISLSRSISSRVKYSERPLFRDPAVVK